jgi:predicted TPR repeat methyltransferase
MSTQDLDPVIEQAQLLLKQGKANEAARHLSSQSDASIQHPMYWFTYGVAQAESGDIVHAAQSFEQALKYSPSNLMILTSLGRAYNVLQQYDKAAEYLQQALAINPSHNPAISLLIMVYIALEQPTRAEALCDVLYGADPNNAEVLLQFGLIRKLQNRFDEAISFFDRALILQPDEVNILVNKGLSLQATGNIDGAITIFQRLVEVDQENAKIWYILAIAWLASSNLIEGIKCFEKAFALNPADIETGRQLAQSLRHVGRVEDSELVCKKILRIDPENAEALFFQDAFSRQKNNESLGRVPAEVTRQIYKGEGIGKRFDSSLKNSLEYKVPEVLNDAVREAILSDSVDRKINILELGCGSGLCGSRFSDIASSLIGTDISPDMLAAAKEKNAYTDLYAADLTDVLDKYDGEMDLIIAMDVLCYFGDLTQIFQRCANALTGKGIFAFSVVKPMTPAIWELHIKGFFVHSLDHLEQVAANTGFSQIYSKELPLRRELNEDQYGYVCLYQKT